MSTERIIGLAPHNVLLALGCLFIYSCTSNLYVAPKQVDCSAVAAQKCYLIRSSSTGNWIMHNREIEGFDYELGFSYKIKVKRENIKKPPAGGPSYRYLLVKITEQKDVAERIELEDLLNKEWMLEYLIWNHTQYGVEGTAPTVRFERDGNVSGNGSCNKLFSSFTLDGRTIDMAEIGSTKMMCEGKMEIEEAFTNILGLEMRAIFDDGKLVLSTDGGNKMIFDHN